MLQEDSPLTRLRDTLASGKATPGMIASDVLAYGNSNASENTYLWLSERALREQVENLRPGPLYGVPISLKDCFDLAGTPTSCGSRAYAAQHANALGDSALVARVRSSGALITGKTHLHPLAYGITGQNADYGDCLQPRDATLLTGGSSSGAAASVQEGSALVAIGTDTGGSIRVPAALCGLTGYRASHAMAYRHQADLWGGGAHLAPSFDTLGFLLEDPRDALPVASGLFDLTPAEGPLEPRIGWIGAAFLTDAQPDVIEGYAMWRALISGGDEFASDWWHDSREIFGGIQASEAATLHEGTFDQWNPWIADRLRWGASLSVDEVGVLRGRLDEFQQRMARLWAEFDLLIMPCSPVTRLIAAEDQSNARAAILRYTTPFSLAGVPVISIPGELVGAPFGSGIQIAAASGQDAALLTFAGDLMKRISTREG